MRKFQWSPFFHTCPGVSYGVMGEDHVPFDHATGLAASFVHETRKGSLALVGRTMAMPMLYQSGCCAPTRSHSALLAGGLLPSTAVITTTGSVRPFHSLGTDKEPSKEPCASYQLLCGTPDGFWLGTMGGGRRVQWIRSLDTTWSQWFCGEEVKRAEEAGRLVVAQNVGHTAQQNTAASSTAQSTANST